MNRKPIFDAIRYERDLPIAVNEIPYIDQTLSALGFPSNQDPTGLFVSPEERSGKPQIRGLFRRDTIFDTIRRERGSILGSQVEPIDRLLTLLKFPGLHQSAKTPAKVVTDEEGKIYGGFQSVTPTPPPPKGLVVYDKDGKVAYTDPDYQDPTLVPKTPLSTSTKTKASALVALVGVTAAALITTSLDRWEGNELVGYKDIVGIATNCRGNTQNVVVGKRYTAEQCAIINEAAAVRHASPVLQATPSLQNHPNQLAAAVSLAYNIGNGAWSKSTADRLFDQGAWLSACKAMTAYNRAGGRVVKGLVNRRQWEYSLCIKDIPVEKAR